MRYTVFGRTGLRVSPVALGTGRLGRNGGGMIDPHQAEAIVHQYVDIGGNLIDTSDAYLGGRSEELWCDPC